jgi:hypothetical protein
MYKFVFVVYIVYYVDTYSIFTDIVNQIIRYFFHMAGSR